MVESVVECIKSAMNLLDKEHPEPPIILTGALYDATVELGGGKPFYTIDHRRIYVM